MDCNYNYAITAQKPTSVTHSCVGSFTSPNDRNLIIAKGSRLEIHLITPHEPQLQLLLDVTIYGRVSVLELFRPRDELQDLLFLATEGCQTCVLQWDAMSSELITRSPPVDLSDCIGRPTNYGQIGTIDPQSIVIGVHLYDDWFKVVPLDNSGQLENDLSYSYWLEGFHGFKVLDIKFLHGCDLPTFAVLFQDNNDARHAQTYVVNLAERSCSKGELSRHNLGTGSGLLIPVTQPPGSVLIIGEEQIVYCSALSSKEIGKAPSPPRAYGKIDDFKYLLGDNAGEIHMLVVGHENQMVTDLELKCLGVTSIASTISYLGDSLVFVGSRYGDSQLIKLKESPDSKGSVVEVLRVFVNLGPIVDLCLVNSSLVFTCSGAFRDCSVRVIPLNGKDKAEISTIRLGEQEHARCICYQAQSSTFAICTKISEKHFVRLYDETYQVLSSFSLNATEHGCSMLSCFFTDDRKEYYCLGTAYVLPRKKEPSQGRILVFEVKERKLHLIALKEVRGAVYSLNALKGKVLASINQNITLFKWDLQARKLQFECGNDRHILPIHVKTRGNVIVLGDLMNSLSVLIYKEAEGTIEKVAQDNSAKWMTAVEMLDSDICLGADNNSDLLTMKRNTQGATEEEQGRLDLVGSYHLGEIVNKFCRVRGDERALIFGTIGGMIGLVSSVSDEDYIILEKLQSCMSCAGVGGLSHKQWRRSSGFLDGDLIESFLGLSQEKKKEISKEMDIEVIDYLCEKIEKLRRLH